MTGFGRVSNFPPPPRFFKTARNPLNSTPSHVITEPERGKMTAEQPAVAPRAQTPHLGRPAIATLWPRSTEKALRQRRCPSVVVPYSAYRTAAAASDHDDPLSIAFFAILPVSAASEQKKKTGWMTSRCSAVETIGGQKLGGHCNP